MARVAGSLFAAAALLLVSTGVHCRSPRPACPESCTCQRTHLMNCSTSGLSLMPDHIQDSVTELDLSHNLLDSVTLQQPHRNLRNVWLGNNSVTHLSLCIKRNPASQNVRGTNPLPLPGGCVSWAPTLQLLSVERNQLEQLPEGLNGSESLQVLQLSFNRISTLRPEDLANLRQLRELHLQHNLITSLHPQMLQDLARLKVLDVSFNMMTSLHPLMYLSLRNIGAEVSLGGNRWHCDCNMRSLRRWMTYDSSRGLQSWTVVCDSPSSFSGTDLLQLEEDDLHCFTVEHKPQLPQHVTVHSGSGILLSCSATESLWWMPHGREPVKQPQLGLLIRDIQERDAGLYVCASDEREAVSVFNPQISKIGGTRRQTRSASGSSQQIVPQGTLGRTGQERNQTPSQADLTLAVCLSVFITFLIAFILGVLARPLIDILWRKITNKKRSSATHSVSSVEQRQYDNEAYANFEDLNEAHRERRVTFSTVDFKIDSNVQYYDAVINSRKKDTNNHVVLECEEAEVVKDEHKSRDSESDHSLQESTPDNIQRDGRDLTDAGRTLTSDVAELEDRRSLSSHSSASGCDSVSQRDQRTQGEHTAPTSPQLAEDRAQQSGDCSTPKQVSFEGKAEIPGFSSEPFVDWIPHRDNDNLSDPEQWQENEEQFEFSDSVRSTSGRSSSLFGSFNHSNPTVAPTSNRSDSSSLGSYVSEGEPSQYTMNQEEATGRNSTEPEDYDTILTKNPRLEQTIHAVEPSLGVTSHSRNPESTASAVYSSSSSSEGEEEFTNCKEEFKERIKVTESSEPEPLSVDLNYTNTHLKRRPDINTQLASGSSSSDDGEDETTKHTEDQKQEECSEYQSVGHDVMQPQSSLKSGTQYPFLHLGQIPPVKRRLDVKVSPPPCESSSSSDSEDEKSHTEKQEQEEMFGERIPIKVTQTVSHDLDARWPILDLENVPRIKRHLDINGPSPASGSSTSSDSEDETRVNQDPETDWPAIDLDRNIHIKRRLDIKASSPPSDSSSSSDGEAETSHTEKQEQEDMFGERIPIKVSQTVSHDPDARWPILDLEHIPRNKRHLDIKGPSPASGSSTTSDSKDEATVNQDSGTQWPAVGLDQSHDLEKRFPLLDLDHIPPVQRRLDIKASSPPSDSSSSSESEAESSHTEKQEQEEVFGERIPVKVSQIVSHDPDAQRPILDLENVPHIKRRLDVKVQSFPDLSSKSVTVKENMPQIKAQGPGEESISTFQIQESEVESQQPYVEATTSIKRRLDIKAPSSALDSSSSESEVETTNHTDYLEQEEMFVERIPVKVTQTVSHDPDARWPILDLEHIPRNKRHLDIKGPSPTSGSSTGSDSKDETRVNQDPETDWLAIDLDQSHDLEKRFPLLDLGHIPPVQRRLDIKASSPPSDSSSSSDSEAETSHMEKQEQEEMFVKRIPGKVSQTVSHDPDAQWPTLDLENVPRIKRRLDVKAPTPASYSSSGSDNKAETTVNQDPETDWPAIDLDRNIHIKRRLDIKASSPPSDSSSSSDGEAETSITEKQEQEEMCRERIPIKVPQTVRPNPDPQWPILDLENVPRIKTRLDVKAPSPASGSSFSAEREYETAVNQDSKTKWPNLDLVQVTPFKRRLDIKTSSPRSDSFSQRVSEDETISHSEKQEQEARSPIKVPKNVSPDPEAKWPLLDLGHIPPVQRRLDIKASSPPSDSSSSSDGEAETSHTKKQEQEKIFGERIPIKVSQTVSLDPDPQWPILDLENVPRIKRHLDIKVVPPPSASSFSSDREYETAVRRDSKTKWPNLDLVQVTPFKRRLDIKTSSPRSDSFSQRVSEDETISHSEKQEQEARSPIKVPKNVSPDPEAKWPLLDLGHIPPVQRRLDIKASSPPSDSSSSSDGEAETSHTKKQEQEDMYRESIPIKVSQTASHDPDAQWPFLDLENVPRIKRRLDIKAPTLGSGSSFSSEREYETAMNQDSGTTLSLGQSTQVKNHLGIEAPSPASASPSSCDDSDDETTGQRITNQPRTKFGVERSLNIQPPYQPGESSDSDHERQLSSPTVKYESNLGVRHINRHLDIKTPPRSDAENELIGSPKSPVINIPQRAEKEHRLKLENFRFFSNDVGDKTDRTTPEMNPELESKWATMNLGFSRFRKRLEITSQTQVTPNPPTSPPPASPSSASSESEFGFTPDQSQTQATKMQGKSPAELTDHLVPDLSLGVPRVKRRLNIRTRSPQPSSSPSSCSEGENEVVVRAEKQSGVTDSDSLIHYKRAIIKASSLPSDFSTSRGIDQSTKQEHKSTVMETAQEGSSSSVGDRKASRVPKTTPVLRFDDIKNKLKLLRGSRDVGLPPEIRWTGAGRHLPDLPIPYSPGRTLSQRPLSPLQAPPGQPGHLPAGSSSSIKSEDEMKQDRGEANVKPMQQYSSLNPNSVSLSSPLHTFDSSLSSTKVVPEDRRDRKGLTALKAMSSERRLWDTEDEHLVMGTPAPTDDKGPWRNTRSEADVKPLAKQPKPEFLLPSTSLHERTVPDIRHRIPPYGRHVIEDTEPPKGLPPPVPTAPPPPDEDLQDPTWGSQQSSFKQTRDSTSYRLQQKRSTRESDPHPFMQPNLTVSFDPSNISEV